MKDLQKVTFCGALALLVMTDMCVLAGAHAAPSAEIAKKCMHYSYIAYPYQRPGSVKMSGDRQSYFRDCMAKEGNLPEPTPPKAQ